jgi:hypothetical protein
MVLFGGGEGVIELILGLECENVNVLTDLK